MQLTAYLFALALVLFLGQQALRRTGPGAAFGLFLALPLLLTPVWAQGDVPSLCWQFGSPTFFCWLKLYSILVAACWFTWLRFQPLQQQSWLEYLSLSILPVNILEAVVQDLVSGRFLNYIDAASGALLIIALCFSRQSFRSSTRGRCRDLVCDGISRTWIIGYSIWNWVFLYLNYPVLVGQHLVVLGIAAIVGIVDPGRWLQCRTYTLAMALCFAFTFPNFCVFTLGTVSWTFPQGEWVAAWVSFSLTLLIAMSLASARIRKLHHPSMEMGVGIRQLVAEP